MGTAEWRAAKSPSFFSRGDYMPGLKVDGMDVLAVKKVCVCWSEWGVGGEEKRMSVVRRPTLVVGELGVGVLAVKTVGWCKRGNEMRARGGLALAEAAS